MGESALGVQSRALIAERSDSRQGPLGEEEGAGHGGATVQGLSAFERAGKRYIYLYVCIFKSKALKEREREVHVYQFQDGSCMKRKKNLKW